MAAKSNPDPVTPQSTGAVKTPAEPVTTEQTADNTSTDAVKSDGYPVATEAPWHGADAVVRSETPTEPVTMSVSWLSDAQAKVVEPEAEAPAPKKTARARTKKKA